MAQAAQTLTPVSLELGGKDPMIVLADADLERATNAAISYGLNNSGQVCISVERIYVEESVHDEFVDKLTEKVRGLRQGPPGRTGHGRRRGDHLPAPDGDHRGARPRRGRQGREGRHRRRAGRRPGRFYPPTILTGVDHSMSCMVEETFGPTLPVMRVADAERAIELANEGPYGLQASVWTRDEQRGEEVARRVEAGSVCVNDAQVNYAALELPMGGWKESGLGSRHGKDGIRKYTRRQSLMVVPGYAPSRDAHHFPYSAQASQAMGEAFAALATSDILNDAQRATLIALCDTFIPSLPPPDGEPDPHGFWARAASHAAVPEGVEIALLQAELPDEQIEGLRELLDSLAESGMAMATPAELREEIVLGFCDQSPEALAGITPCAASPRSLFYALPDLGTGRNPTWDAIGYPGPIAPPPDRPRPLEMHRPEGAEEVIDADVCIVGSGAGGGVIAGELAARGQVGRACSRWAATTTTATSTSSSSPPTSACS